MQAEQDGYAAVVIVSNDWCNSCGINKSFSQKSAIPLNECSKAVIDGERCNACGMCEFFYPDFAIAKVKRRLPANAGN